MPQGVFRGGTRVEASVWTYRLRVGILRLRETPRTRRREIPPEMPAVPTGGCLCKEGCDPHGGWRGSGRKHDGAHRVHPRREGVCQRERGARLLSEVGHGEIAPDRVQRVQRRVHRGFPPRAGSRCRVRSRPGRKAQRQRRPDSSAPRPVLGVSQQPAATHHHAAGCRRCAFRR